MAYPDELTEFTKNERLATTGEGGYAYLENTKTIKNHKMKFESYRKDRLRNFFTPANQVHQSKYYPNAPNNEHTVGNTLLKIIKPRLKTQTHTQGQIQQENYDLQ